MLNYDFFFSVSLNLNLFYNLVISVQSKSFNFFFKNLIFLSKIYLFFFLALNRTSFIIKRTLSANFIYSCIFYSVI